MTTLDAVCFLGVLTLFTIAFLGWGYMQLLTQDNHRRERTQQADAHRAELQRLLQRIQAPEQAVIEHAAQVIPQQPRHVRFDNDQDYWQAVGVDLGVDHLNGNGEPE